MQTPAYLRRALKSLYAGASINSRLRSKRPVLSAESLEPRCLLAASSLTPGEQYMLELVNRARANPSAEASRQGISLNAGLTAGTISTAAKQPLAPENLLANAAGGHTDDMLARGFFLHTSPAPGSTTFGQRVTNAGYPWSTTSENLAIRTYSSFNEATLIKQMHDGLFTSASHRVNTMNNTYFEAGLGIDFGSFKDNNNALGLGAGVTHNAGLTTISFASRTTKPFITGVVYTDASDGSATDDAFFSIGEQTGNGATITATDTSSGAVFTELVGSGGGYSIQVPAGTYTVTATGGTLSSTYRQTSVVVGTENVKIDFETTTASTSVEAPSITTAHNTVTTDQRLTINWTSVTGATRYEISYTQVATNTPSFVSEQVSNNAFTPSTDLPISKYYIWVRVNNSDGTTSDWSSPITIQVDVPVSTNSLEYHQTTLTPTISWAPVTGAVRYEVWGNNLTAQTTKAIHSDSITSTSLTPSSNLDFGIYRLWVRAYDASGLAASWSNGSLDFYIGPQLSGPILPTVDTTPEFSWTTINGAATYQLFVQKGSTAVINQSGLSATTYTDPTGLSVGDYRWWVRPSSADGKAGAWSQMGEFNVGGWPVVQSPSGTTTFGAPTISWTPVSGAGLYDVYLYNLSTSSLQIRQNQLTTDSWVTPALPDADYRVWVRAYETDGTPAFWSRAHNFTVDSATTSLPVTAIQPNSPTFDTTPTLAWNAAPGAATYDLHLHNGTNGMTQSGLSTTSWTPAPASPLSKDQWNWWILARDSSGAAGEWSSLSSMDLTARPVLIGPTGTISETLPTFNWSSVEGAARYILQVDNLSATTTSVIREDHLTSPTYSATTALSAGNYRFWIQAVSSFDTRISPWSVAGDFKIANANTETAESDSQLVILSWLRQRQPVGQGDRVRKQQPVKADHRNDAIDFVMQQAAAEGFADTQAIQQ